MAVAGTCGWLFASRFAATARWNRERAARRESVNPDFARIYGGSAVKILDFYGRDANMTEGDPTVLCYGVLNARAVRIEPAVEGVSPALSRCVAVAPEQDTRYTLYAEGNDGRTVAESFVLPVKADSFLFPKVKSFGVVNHIVDRGRHVFLLTFEVANPEEVSIDPPVFPPMWRAPNGKFYVSPAKSTTYTLTVTDKRGRKAWKQLVVDVPGA